MQKININTNWLYTPQNINDGHTINLNEAEFEKVCIPHANKILEAHKGEDFNDHIASYRFISWYRRHFKLDSSYTGKRVAIEFEAVATVADVYVNGCYVGGHKGAYTPFTLDITKYVKFDGSDNVIAVKVDSTQRRDLPPEGHQVDYLLFGGIVRDVYMIISNLLYVEWTYMTTPELDTCSGRLNAQAKIVNSSNIDVDCAVETKLVDANKVLVLAMTTQCDTVAAGSALVCEQLSNPIANIHLWSIKSPYLYTVVTSIIVDGEIIDEYETIIGFRFFEFKNEPHDAGFYLNNEKIKINGINRHEQWPWIGRAVPSKLQIADADLIKSTGINAVRASHYPQKTEFIKRCDEIGLLVFAEPPGWQHIGDKQWQDYFAYNLEELIIRDRNHPSIISWGVRPNEAPTSGDEDRANKDFFENTNALARRLDPTRPTHGSRVEFLYEQSDLFTEDIYTVNYRYPNKPKFTPFIITEHTMSWGKQGMANATDTMAMQWIDDWAKSLDYIYENNLVAGGFGWSMFDYNNEVNYTKTGHVFPSGLYDIFRHDKPVAWLYRSQKAQSDETVLYIANYWTQESPSRVLVLSNCEEVELFVGDDSRGRITANRYMNLPYPVYEFIGIEFNAMADLKAVGYIAGLPVKETVRKTPCVAAKLVVKPDYDVLVADGADMTCVTVSVVDAAGTRLPYADNNVTIAITGPGKFIGQSTIGLEGGRVGFIVQSKLNKTGIIKCTVTTVSTVTSHGVITGECTITVHAP
ncbi:MAG: hypothetical protein FWC92_03810 [Defluviitaleaceae bacterium]|nr:hypothetical protein [Defluviitaleaceae bacterium]